VLPLPAQDAAEIPTFVLFAAAARGMDRIAGFVDVAQQLGSAYTTASCELPNNT